MAKLLTVFNLLAGAASLAGLYVTLALGRQTPVIGILFGLAAVMSLYVLLVPESPLERNVRGKLERYANPSGSGQILIQRGRFTIAGFGPAAAAPPLLFDRSELNLGVTSPRVLQLVRLMFAH